MKGIAPCREPSEVPCGMPAALFIGALLAFTVLTPRWAPRPATAS